MLRFGQGNAFQLGYLRQGEPRLTRYSNLAHEARHHIVSLLNMITLDDFAKLQISATTMNKTYIQIHIIIYLTFLEIE